MDLTAVETAALPHNPTLVNNLHVANISVHSKLRAPAERIRERERSPASPHLHLNARLFSPPGLVFRAT